MNELALFAGAGGGLLASKLLGWSTVGAVEIEQYPRDILMRRQEDGHLEPFPIWDDVCTFDGRPWRGTVDVVSGGFPCQDISSAGKGAGLAGDRSGLWFEYLRIVDEVRPRFVFAENSPNLRTRGLGTVVEGLVSLGYGVRWCVLGAWHVGAPHKRDRMWVLAHAPINRRQQGIEDNRGCKEGVLPRQEQGSWNVCGNVAHADSSATTQRGQHATSQGACSCGRDQLGGSGGDGGERCATTAREAEGVSAHDPGQRPYHQADIEELEGAGQGELHTVQPGDSEDVADTNTGGASWWETEPRLDRVANGVADRVDRLKAIGNGQVPAVAAIAWQTLSQGVA
jgi:DNA (cytosine-5)-methyltransferase 1